MLDLNTGVLAWLQLLLLVALAACVGYMIGARRSRQRKRELQRALGSRELELLDARAEVSRLAETLEDVPRKQRMMQLLMTRLRDAKERERKLFIDVARLRLSSVEATSRLRKAVQVARSASARVKQLEAERGATGTITTCAPKSYGNGKAVTVSVVDHETPDARLDGVTRVSHLERARFTNLPPSNEAGVSENPALNGAADNATAAAAGVAVPEEASWGQPDKLSAIDGLAEADEDRLNSLGIHRLEQLAELSERERERLDALMGRQDSGRPLASWIGDARALIDARTTN